MSAPDELVSSGALKKQSPRFSLTWSPDGDSLLLYLASETERQTGSDLSILPCRFYRQGIASRVRSLNGWVTGGMIPGPA